MSHRRRSRLALLVFATTVLAAAVVQPPSSFTIALIPDTQYYSKRDPQRYFAQAESIARWRDSANIVFAIHLGDVTNDHDKVSAQWDVADSAHRILENRAIRYSVVPGNHDMPKLADADSTELSRDMSAYNEVFRDSRFGTKYGSMPGRPANKFWTFEVGSLEFTVIGLEFAPSKDAVCWADSVIRAHSTRRILVTTHCYQGEDGERKGNCASRYRLTGSDGNVLWRELIRRHSNVTMVLSGHINESEHRGVTGLFGNPVQELLTDFQQEPDEDDTDGRTGNGWLRFMTFVPSKDSVYVKTRTVKPGVTEFFELDNYSRLPTAADHQFRFYYPMGPLPAARHAPPMNAFHDRTVNPQSRGQQMDPAIAGNASGHFVVAWYDDHDQNGFGQIYARIFDQNGCEQARIIPVNPVSDGHQRNPAVAMNPAGNIVVVWEDDRDGNGFYQIRARGFGPDGTERFGEIVVNAVSDGQQLNPTLDMANNGNFVVTWQDDRNGNGVYEIRARGFTATGAQRIAEFKPNAVADGQQRRPDVGVAANGDFFIVWEDDRNANGFYQIRARGFTHAGAQLFSERTVNSTSAGQQRRPRVDSDAAGNFVVVWEDDRNENGVYQIRMRGYSRTGVTRFTDRTVNDVSDGQQLRPDVALDASGEFSVVWEDDRNNNDVYQIRGRRFSNAGAARTGDQTINFDAGGQQGSPAIAMTGPLGRRVITWQDDLNGNHKWEVLARGFGPMLLVEQMAALRNRPLVRVP